MSDGAQIGARTFSSENAGDIEVTATSIKIIGTSLFGPSALFTTVSQGAMGEGGDLSITTDRLRVEGGAQIAVSTAGDGKAGNLTVTAKESVELIGGSQEGRSGLFASAIIGKGDGGNLEVKTGKLLLQKGGIISVSNFSSRNPDDTPAGQGAAGNLEVAASLIQLENDSIITANTASGDRGNITLTQVDNLLMLNNSRISTDAQGSSTGGNITITTDTLTALNNSDITANAQQGEGGKVTINAKGIFGTQFREQLTSASDITASSELGAEFNGVVEIKTPEIDTMSGFAVLSSTMIKPTEQVTKTCNREVVNQNVFIITNKGGLPTAPHQTLSANSVWRDFRHLDRLLANNSNRIEVTSNEPSLVEAQSWLTDEDGKLKLVNQSMAILLGRRSAIAPGINGEQLAQCGK